jgi:hypothetical protein
MPPSSRQRGSGGPPLLRDYLLANQQQGAQQAQGMAQHIGQQQEAARAQTDAAERSIQQARMAPAYGPNVPGINPSTPTAENAKKALERPEVGLAETEAGRAATQQVSRASAMGQLATTPAGMAAINAQRMGLSGPRSSGGSFLDAATTNYGGGGQVRAQARQGVGLRDYLSGAAKRGNTAANNQLNVWAAPPPADPVLTAPRQPAPAPRYPQIDGTGRPLPLKDRWREDREYNFGG